MSIRRRVLAFLTVLLSALTVGAIASSPARAAIDEVYLTAIHSGKAMVVLNAGTNDNQPAVQWAANNAAPNNDKMRLQYLRNNNEYFIRPMHSNKCLVVKNASFALYARIIQYRCADDGIDDNDIWHLERVPVRLDGQDYQFPQWRNKASHLCLAVLNASTANGAELIQYTCNQSRNSIWRSWANAGA